MGRKWNRGRDRHWLQRCIFPAAGHHRFSLTPPHGARYVTLGDGSTVLLNLYRASVIWDGQPRIVQVMETEDVCLIGMSLLYGYRLTVDVIDGGSITIEHQTLSMPE